MNEKYLVIFIITKEISGFQKDNPEIQINERNIGEFNPSDKKIVFFDSNCTEWIFTVGKNCEIFQKF